MLIPEFTLLTIFSDNVSVIDTATNIVVATIPVGTAPYSIALGPVPPAPVLGAIDPHNHVKLKPIAQALRSVR